MTSRVGAVSPLLALVVAGCLADNPFYVAPLGGSESATTGVSASESSITATSTSTSTTTGGASESEGSSGAAGVCGDGIVDPSEACDDGVKNGSTRSTCDAECALREPVCGNGQVEVGEECDDGDHAPGDGCDPDCKIEPPPDACGDGLVGGGEACDDGNLIGGDGCEPDCTPTPPGVCGDGDKAWDELCDDGNLANGDGCEADCTPTLDALCLAPEAYVACDGALNKDAPLAPFRALGLACSDKNDESLLITEGVLVSPEPKAYEIASAFGTYKKGGVHVFGAREGESILVLSTGLISPPQGGVIVEAPGSQVNSGMNANPDDNNFLPGYAPADDQSGVLAPFWAKSDGNPNDKIFLSFKTTAPIGAAAYSLDFAFFSSEWPQFVDTPYSDLLVLWQVSEGFVGNVSTIDGKATSSTSLHPHWSLKPVDLMPKTCVVYGDEGPGYACAEPQLIGTGFEGHAGSTWLRLNQPIDPGEELTVYVFLADMADTVLASVVLLDRFRFLCEPCVPQNDPSCAGPAPDLKCCGVALPKAG